jgi:hypothetical protein
MMPHDEGMTQEQAIGEADGMAAETAANRQAETAQAAPPADEPLTAETLNSFGEMLLRAIAQATGGEMEPTLQPVEGDQQQIPPDLFQGAAAFASLARKFFPDLAFDAVDLSRTNQGVKEMGAIVSEIGGRKPPKEAAPKPEQASAPKERAMSDLVPPKKPPMQE